MLASKSKSRLSDASNSKTTPASPRVNKLGRAGSTKSESLSPSLLQNSRSSTDRSSKSVNSKLTLQSSHVSVSRSPHSVGSKPTVVRRSPKISKLPDKQQQAVAGSESNVHLGVVEEDLKKAREQLASVEQEKAQALQDLKDAKRLSDDANEKLKEALVAHKRAKESSEFAKLRADELEQAGVEAGQKREEEWQKELENLRNQYAVEAMALFSTTQELQRVKGELVVTSDVKNTALSHTYDSIKIAEINAEKVESLSKEVNRLKAFLDSRMEGVSSENAELVRKLNSEVDGLKRELERAKAAEEKSVMMEALVEGLRSEVIDATRAEMDAGKLTDELKRKAEMLEARVEEANRYENETSELMKKLDSEIDALKRKLERANAAEKNLVEMEALVERLSNEVTDAKTTEMDARKLVDEWKRKAELLEVRVEEANQSEESSLDSLALATKQLEESNALLQDSRSEIAALKGIMESLEIEVTTHKEDLNGSDQRFDVAHHEALELGKTVEVLKSKLQAVEEEKLQALSNAKIAASNIESLSEEKNKLMNALVISRDEEAEAKGAMEGLASALHEVSTEARESHELLLIKQAESEDAHAHIEELRVALKSTEESYEVMLDDAKYEIVCLKNSIERYEMEGNTSKAEWITKELSYINAIEKLEEELAALRVEMRKAVDSLKGLEHKAQTAMEARKQMLTNLRQAEYAAAVANEVAEEAKDESLRLKGRLLATENELQSITQENNDLRIREADALAKARVLSALLSEVAAKRTEENDELTNSEDTDGSEGRSSKQEAKLEDANPKEENGNGSLNEEEEAVDDEAKWWESCKVTDKGLAPVREHEAESTDDEYYSKMDSSSSDPMNRLPSQKMGNGAISPAKFQQRKKKKAFLRKFGNLLKKKGNHK